jgi:hypothetical protein
MIRSTMLGPLDSTAYSYFMYTGSWIRIDSGYRCPHGNKLVGGVAASRHMNGDAVDIKPQNYPAGDMAYADWLILRNTGRNSGFTFNEAYADDETHVHVDMR